MITATYILVYVAAALYLMAAFEAHRYARSGDVAVLFRARRFYGIGGFMCLAALLVRWATWHMAPLTTLLDVLALLLFFASVVTLLLERNEPVPALLCFYVPPLALMAVFNAATATMYLSEPPRELTTMPLLMHVLPAFLAYALFFLASMTSAAYLFQARNLKRGHTGGLFKRLPSLERLSLTLQRLLKLGYPCFAVTLVLGWIWAFTQRGVLGPQWYLSPKIVLAVLVAAFYGAVFHLSRLGKLRGAKLAHLVFWGFYVVILIYAALSMAGMRTAHFWGDTP